MSFSLRPVRVSETHNSQRQINTVTVSLRMAGTRLIDRPSGKRKDSAKGERKESLGTVLAIRLAENASSPKSMSNRMAEPGRERVILAYGDSQGEVMDYVFHGSAEYIKYADDPRVGWRSGWSTRGLGKAEHVARFLEPLSELESSVKHAFVLLSYGSVDIEWNLSYKRDVLKQDVDTNAFIEEMCCALSKTVDSIVQRGKELRERPEGGPEVHIVLCVPFVPLPLSDGYLEEFERRNGGDVRDAYRVIAHDERIKLWSQFCDASQQRILAKHPHCVHVADVRDDFTTNGFEAYMLKHEEDHHPDLAKSQHAVAERIESLSFAAADGGTLKLETKLWPKAEMYPHVRRRFGPQPKPSTHPSPESSRQPSPQTSPKTSPSLPPAAPLPAPLCKSKRTHSSDSIIELPETWQLEHTNATVPKTLLSVSMLSRAPFQPVEAQRHAVAFTASHWSLAM